MSTFNALDWYWDVNGIGTHRDTADQIVPAPTRVYSSNRGTYVAVDDVAYLSWKDINSLAQGLDDPTTQIDTEASLNDVLAVYGLHPVS